MSSRTHHLTRDTGQIAYNVAGAGPLILCVPGMGETKESYRDLIPHLTAAGYTVATMDLRGHGESGTTFHQFDNRALASDILALIHELSGPAIVVGSSMAAGAAVIAAAQTPHAINGLVLTGPFVRNSASPVMAALFRIALMRPWGRLAWIRYYSSLFATKRPAWLEAHIAERNKQLKQLERWKAFTATTTTDHSHAEAVLGAVQAPTLVIMGTRDPDWKYPQAEAQWIAQQLDCETLLVEAAGHYPHVEEPTVTAQVITTALHTWKNHA
ncbi:alpha/beta fold hydrolase [Timonella sp. A28]|uniref:alpha/beta fold hydrolase n=1 Tax=Timonella sp. A28 TaxID=3442640 RepID=UPI003EB77336